MSDQTISAEAADELVRLLKAGIFEEFLTTYRRAAGEVTDGAVILAEMINERMLKERPGCEAPIVVSQKLDDKHLVVIQDGSRFFGSSWTVTRSAFVV